MKSIAKLIALAAIGAALVGCSGKGLDKNISRKDEASYRETLNQAWKDMTEEQQNAFNWAVSNLDIPTLQARYADKLTPRNVIESEATQHAQAHTKNIADLTAALVRRKAEFDQVEAEQQAIKGELAKVTAKSIHLTTEKNVFGTVHYLNFISFNGSKYDLTSVTWSATMFIDGEQKSNRTCKFPGWYKRYGGLKSGAEQATRIDFGGGYYACGPWQTLEAKNAKTYEIQMVAVPDTAEDFAEEPILPSFEDERQQLIDAIEDSKKQVEIAAKAKASLT